MQTNKYTFDAVVATARRPPPATRHPPPHPPPPCTNIHMHSGHCHNSVPTARRYGTPPPPLPPQTYSLTEHSLHKLRRSCYNVYGTPPAPNAGAIGVAIAVAHALASALALGDEYAVGEGCGRDLVAAAGRVVGDFVTWAAGARCAPWARPIAAQAPLADPAAAAAPAPAPSAECGTGRGGQLRASVSLPQPQTQVW
eukprot:gene19608-biopygen44078